MGINTSMHFTPEQQEIVKEAAEKDMRNIASFCRKATMKYAKEVLSDHNSETAI